MKKLILIISIVALIIISGCTQISFEPCPGFHPASQDKAMCLVDYAEQHRDSSICEIIQSEIYKDECYNDVGILTNDIELCKKMVSRLWRSGKGLCFKKIAVNLTDEKICEHISDEGQRDGCYRDVASITKSETTCEKIIPEWSRKECIKDSRGFPPECWGKDYCIIDYAEQYEDSEVCDLIHRELIREGCRSKVAVLTNNINLCREITSGVGWQTRDLCFKTIAINLADETICKHISDTGKPSPQSQYIFKDKCYDEIAELTKHKTVCDKITNEKLREECIKDSSS